MNEKDLKIIRYLAGAIFLALALSSFLLYIYPFLFASASSAYTAYSSASVIRDIVSAIGAVMMAVSMLLGMRQVFMVGAGFQAVSCLIKLLFSHMGAPAQDIVNIFSCILSLDGYVLIALTIQEKKNAAKYEILSIALFLIGCVTSKIALYGKVSVDNIAFALEDFVLIASPILLAYIVLENVPQAQTTKMVKQPPKTVKSDNRIEELTKLKDLLDTGIITQEEFDMKKKQILGV